MYIHESVKTGEFIRDKKLNLLKNGVINLSQFINLIDKNDPYTIIGPAIVDKNKVNEFIEQWKASTVNVKTLEEAFLEEVKPQNIVNKFDQFMEYFPEVTPLINQYREKANEATCPVCQRNRYIINIISKIKDLYKDGRYLGDLEEFVNFVVNKYFPLNNKVVSAENANEFDIMWVKPDTLIGLGNDLIYGLSNCFDCCKKHIGRAKALYEEWHLGYPEHSSLMYKEFTEANKDIEEGYVLYWDSLAQLDMGSCELVGDNFGNLPNETQLQMIELANKIRTARILFQEDSTKVPNWDQLRIEVQKLQNKLTKLEK